MRIAQLMLGNFILLEMESKKKFDNQFFGILFYLKWEVKKN